MMSPTTNKKLQMSNQPEPRTQDISGLLFSLPAELGNTLFKLQYGEVTSSVSERFGSVSTSSLYGNIRSPYEFLDFQRMTPPMSFVEAQDRMIHNIPYFYSNYAIIVAMLGVYALLNNFWLLFFILLIIGGIYGISMLGGADLVIGEWWATSSQLYSTLVIIAVPVFFMSSPLATVMWLLGFSSFTIMGHAALMAKPGKSTFH
ncbi:hypothetical protein BT63DRAFT_218955 [Microthyrium microscopicum]|uniref:PRA1 family protein n=1 Tax=Microthyrium microscopicum TaxID=703497 RepID=A0A6A6UI68_9PEZI|nr:hypothetical protein BT63DRAFT_218955 [Microthyrium microscopicum]